MDLLNERLTSGRRAEPAEPAAVAADSRGERDGVLLHRIGSGVLGGLENALAPHRVAHRPVTAGAGLRSALRSAVAGQTRGIERRPRPTRSSCRRSGGPGGRCHLLQIATTHYRVFEGGVEIIHDVSIGGFRGGLAVIPDAYIVLAAVARGSTKHRARG